MTSTALVPTITNAGLAAAVNAKATGVVINLAQVGVGQGVITNNVPGGYTPDPTLTALKSEAIRVPLLSGTSIGSGAFRVLAQIPASSMPAQYPIWEVGFYLDTSVLFALWSSPAYPLASKTALSDVDLAFDLNLAQIPVGALALTVQEPDAPDMAGVLATLLEVQANSFTQALLMQERIIAANII